MQQLELAWGRGTRWPAGSMQQQGHLIAVQHGAGRREAATVAIE